jgi:glycosyltransferase involved in cell wall biosynthesis
MKIAVIIPCYKVKRHIIGILEKIPSYVDKIYVIDDDCPEGSGKEVLKRHHPDRVKVVFNEHNKGVGGAVKTGFLEALKDQCDIIVKLDGDGQMNPEEMSLLINPIKEELCDYAKGNRFLDLGVISSMPKIRIFGNLMLSFITKFSSGYYDIFDPTNGYLAINAKILKKINLEKIDNRFFFESDMLFRLNLIDAFILDIPINAVYGDEESNLKIIPSIFSFTKKNLKNFIKRILYKYFLKDFNIGSIYLVLGNILFFFGIVSGILSWHQTFITGEPRTAGTVMVSALSILLGFQLLLSFLNYDMVKKNKIPLCKKI